MLRILLVMIVLTFHLIDVKGFAGNGTVKGPILGKNKKLMASFALSNHDGKLFSLNPKVKGYIVVFICNHCPMAKSYYGLLNQLNKQYEPIGYPLIAINPMDSLVYEEETLAEMHNVGKQLQFPYLQDANQVVAKNFNVSYTPEAYVLRNTSKGWQTEYQGAIDEGQYKVESTYIAKAVNNLLNNQPVKISMKETVGCVVRYRK